LRRAIHGNVKVCEQQTDTFKDVMIDM
jgi:hypothetical protein